MTKARTRTTKNVTVSLSEKVNKWAEEMAEEKGYDNFSAYIADLIRQDKRAEEEKALRLKEVGLIKPVRLHDDVEHISQPFPQTEHPISLCTDAPSPTVPLTDEEFNREVARVGHAVNDKVAEMAKKKSKSPAKAE